MAETVEELVVKATPEGIDETTDGLEGMQEQFDETADEMEDTTSVLGDLQERFAGAFGAITAGLAVAVGGLLSQVPVIGEVASGIGSIVDALAFRLDSVLRPALTPLANAFFSLSEAIFSADGPLGKLVDTVLVFGTVLGGTTAAIFAASTAMTALATATLPVSLPVLAVVGAFAALVAVLSTDFLGIRTKVTNALQGIGNAAGTAAGALKDISEATLSGVQEGLSQLENSIADVEEDVKMLWRFLLGAEDTLMRLGSISVIATVGIATAAGNSALDAAKDVGGALKDIGEGTYDAVINFVGEPNATITRIISGLAGITREPFDAVVNVILELKNKLPDLSGTGFGGITGGDGGNDGGGDDLPFNIGAIARSGQVVLDGARVDEQLSQYETSVFSDGGR